ncbi:enoyl-CoA hydratase-related protein [Thalassotalea fusca]
MFKAPLVKDCSLEINDGIACLTMNRHDVRNALTGTAIVDDIVSVVDWINQSTEIAVLVITGNGTAFSAGGNLKDMRDKVGDFSGDAITLQKKYQQGIQRMTLAMDRLTVPAIAAVNGPAIGAGFDLVNMCDIRIASTQARFGETFINLGLIPGDGGAWLLQRIIGYQKAAELTFTGRVIDADTALNYGILLKVVPEDRLMPAAYQLAEEIASKPHYAIKATKQLMKTAQSDNITEHLQLCAHKQSLCHQEPEHIATVCKLIDEIEMKKAPNNR